MLVTPSMRQFVDLLASGRQASEDPAFGQDRTTSPGLVEPAVSMFKIRPSACADTDVLLRIWLDASRQAHGFIPDSYWLGRLGDMRSVYLPSAQTFVAQDEGAVRAFLSLVDEHLAALFVDPADQRRGYGFRLLEHAKSIRRSLTVTVYVQNEAAMAFYQRQRFVPQGSNLDPATGQAECLMRWTAPA